MKTLHYTARGRVIQKPAANISIFYPENCIPGNNKKKLINFAIVTRRSVPNGGHKKLRFPTSKTAACLNILDSVLYKPV